MTYNEALGFIHSLPVFSGTIDFEKTRILMEHLGSPQNGMKYIHIAGTNGKGSFAAFMGSILSEAGFRVGIYTSPFIERFTERIRLGAEEIPEDELVQMTETVKQTVGEIAAASLPLPTEFDVITAIAFLWFKKRQADIIVLETGMGGRLDSTNVIPSPELAVITSISFDHTAVLGDTLPKIANEKAGIIKPGTDVLLYPQNPDVRKAFENRCSSVGAVLHDPVMGRSTASSEPGLQCMDLNLKESNDPAIRCDLNGKGLALSLMGDYQIPNASMAVNASAILRYKGWQIPDDAILQGLRHTRWPARFELLHTDPVVIADGGHNADGVEKLVLSLESSYPGKKIIYIFGVLSDKDYSRMISTILPSAGIIFTVTVPNPRSLTASDLADAIRKQAGSELKVIPCSDIPAAINAAFDISSKEDVICAFGSLYYIGHVRKYFEKT